MKKCKCGGNITEGQRLTIVQGEEVTDGGSWVFKPKCDLCGAEYESIEDLLEVDKLTLEVDMLVRKGDKEVETYRTTEDLIEALNTGLIEQLHDSLKELDKLIKNDNE